MTRDLMSGGHPACDASDFTVVEDTRTGRVVSSACLISQRFCYEGVELDAGLPELVGTDPDYRRRGLVREQFEVLHRWSERRGHLMQAIAGIANYYRRFGYEMAVWMGAGRRIYAQDVPGKSSGDGCEGSARSYRLRPASSSDAPFLRDLDRRARERYLLTSVRDETLWRYEAAGRDPESEVSLAVKIIEDASNEPLGYVCHAREPRDGTRQVYGYELAGGLSWLRANPFVLNALSEIGSEKLPSITFELGEHHPLYEAIPEPPLYDLDRKDQYSFYVRVPNLPAFLRHLAPTLERRLASSVAAGHTTSLKLSFYGRGLRLDLHSDRSAKLPFKPHNTSPRARGVEYSHVSRERVSRG